MLSFIQHILIESTDDLSKLNTGETAQLHTAAHWARHAGLLSDPQFDVKNQFYQQKHGYGLSRQVLQNRGSKQKKDLQLTVPHHETGHSWTVTTSDPSTSGRTDLEINTTSGTHRPIKVEVKSTRPSLSSATYNTKKGKLLERLTANTPLAQEVIGAYSKAHGLSERQMTAVLAKEEQSRTRAKTKGEAKRKELQAKGVSGAEKYKEPGEKTSRYFYMDKKEETHHPIISAWERGLWNAGTSVLSIADDKGNIRHFSTNPEHEERLSKYVDTTHVQWRDGRLSLRVSGVRVGKQSRKETEGLTWLTKQQVGISPQQVFDLHKN